MKRSGPGHNMNVYMEEFAGTRIEVLDHTDPTLVGIEGVVIWETMNTFLLRTDGIDKMVAKKGGRFRIRTTGEKGTSYRLVLGDDIIYRPVDRTKKCERKIPPRTLSNGIEGPEDPNDSNQDKMVTKKGGRNGRKG